MKKEIKPILLLIIDGWGIAPASDFNVFSKAKTPYIDSLLSQYPATVITNKNYKDISKSYKDLGLNGGFKKLLSDNSLSQLYIADSENFVPLYYYFNNFKKKIYSKETQLPPISRLIDNDWEEYNQELNKELINNIKTKEFDFIATSISILEQSANTNDFDQAILAIETLDNDLKKIIKAALDNDYTIIITSTHGLLEQFIDLATEKIDNSYTSNPLPLMLINDEYKGKTVGWPDVEEGDLNIVESQGSLKEVGATILDLFGIDNEKSLIK